MSDLLLCFALFGTLLCSGDIEKDLNVSPFYNPVYYKTVAPPEMEGEFIKPVIRYEIEMPKSS